MSLPLGQGLKSPVSFVTNCMPPNSVGPVQAPPSCSPTSFQFCSHIFPLERPTQVRAPMPVCGQLELPTF